MRDSELTQEVRALIHSSVPDLDALQVLILLTLVALFGASDERTGYTYLLRVVGFGFILWAIVRKNLSRQEGR